jgi:CHAD domain-containing protein
VLGIGSVSEELGLERTRSFAVVDRGFTLPDLTTVSPVAIVTDPVQIDAATTYFDTVDLRLAARHMTLRHRTGGDGGAWDLRTSGDDPAIEVRTDPREKEPSVPAELTELVRSSVRDKDLVPVASVRTVRVERRLLDAEGRELARVGDDQHHGLRFALGGADLTHWRELSVELLDGDHDLLAAVSSSLHAAGLAPASTAKIDRVLGHDHDAVIDLRPSPLDGTVGGILATRLREGIALLVEQDWALRTYGHDAVLDMRVVVRRLRSDLAIWRPYLARECTDPVRAELSWFGGLLGRLCDAEMLDARLGESVRHLPADMLVGPVAERVQRELQERTFVASERVTAAIESVRYCALLDALESLAHDPPLSKRAAGRAEDVLAARVAKAITSFDRAAGALGAPASPEVRNDRLHEVRKAARRVRYAAGASEPQLGKRARRLAQRMTELQDLLADHRDSVVARETLQEIGAAAHVAGESAFTYGVLHGLERDRGEEALRAFEAARVALGPSKVHRWTPI